MIDNMFFSQWDKKFPCIKEVIHHQSNKHMEFFILSEEVEEKHIPILMELFYF